ncbi:zonular occludens toxin family protein, partial [Vibrio parahaemolyticus V-223/04]
SVGRPLGHSSSLMSVSKSSRSMQVSKWRTYTSALSLTLSLTCRKDSLSCFTLAG